MSRDWLLLVHHVPGRPLYLRAKTLKAIRRWGGVALKNSVYAFPQSAERALSLADLAREVRAAGGQAFLCEARFPLAADEAEIAERFRAERRQDYESLLASLEPSLAAHGGSARGRPRSATHDDRLRERYRLIRANDPFESPMHARVEKAIDRFAKRGATATAPGRKGRGVPELAGKVWITRRGLHVDRLACAWLVRRFVDPRARFRTVEATPKRYEADEVGFDVPGGRFTHTGGRCSFEALLEASGMRDPGLARLGEIVHDLDLGDAKFDHPETAGVGSLLSGALAGVASDEERLAKGLAFFDDLYRSLGKTRAAIAPRPRPERRRS